MESLDEFDKKKLEKQKGENWEDLFQLNSAYNN